MCDPDALNLFRAGKQLQSKPEFGMVDLLSKNSRNTLTPQDIAQASDLILKCLAWVPFSRISASEALGHPFLRNTSL
jgi:serine/threonine protein kinase